MQKIQANGLELAYVREGEGTPLILIHGYPLDHSIWKPVLPLLKESFDLIVPDLRGFGESMAVQDPYGMPDYAADLAGLLDRLEVEQAALVGHSMGGYVALAFAREYPQRVRGLGLVSSQAADDPADRKQGRYKTAEEVATTGVGSVAEGMSTKLTAAPALQEQARRLIHAQKPSGLIGALKAMAERPDSMEFLKDFRLPLVLVHGDADALIPVERAREIRAVAPRARLSELKGVGHLPMMEAPEQTAAALMQLA